MLVARLECFSLINFKILALNGRKGCWEEHQDGALTPKFRLVKDHATEFSLFTFSNMVSAKEKDKSDGDRQQCVDVIEGRYSLSLVFSAKATTRLSSPLAPIQVPPAWRSSKVRLGIHGGDIGHSQIQQP